MLSPLLGAAALFSSRLCLAAPDASEDIRDIRAPIEIPPWWRWPLAIAAAALLSLAIVLAVRSWQKRRAARRTPLELARKALALAEAHARAGRAHAWAELVSETLRSGLARKLGGSVLPKTTTEIALAVRALVPSGAAAQAAPRMLPSADVDELIELLETCDLARFALATADPDALLSRTVAARALTETLFAPEPRSAPAPALPTTVTS